MFYSKYVVSLVVSFGLVACASHPDKLAAASVSPLKYQDYDYEQLGAESDRIGQKVTVLYEQLKGEANADAWQMGVGLVLLWPVLFALEGGDGPEAVEYRQLKGEYDALQQASIQKKCGLDMPDFKEKVESSIEES
jgi:hypothetical protein